MPGISTVALHADREVHPTRAVAPPIYQTATFWAEDAEQFAQAAVSRRGQDFYTRYGNPNHAQVSAVVAELEHAEAAMVTASGMAALTTAVLALVSAGDHVIGQKSTYGGTASVLLNLLPRLGVSTSLVDQTDPEAFEKAMTPQTRLILVESPSNPLLQITDLRAVADLARAHDIVTVADNTFATPVNQRPGGLRHRPGLAQRDQVPQRPLRRVGRRARRPAAVWTGSGTSPSSPVPFSGRSTRGCCCAGCAHFRCAYPATTPTD